MDAIAIVGIACKFPDADDYQAYWKNLISGRNSIKEIPDTRWEVERFYSPNIESGNKSISKWCGLVDGIEHFDSRFFNISPREAKSMDPQQRLLLQETWHCIEDSGVPLSKLQEQITATYVGVMTSDYRVRMDAIDSFAGLGNISSILANRISYFLDLHGESISIDAACASSLVALHKAKQSLLSGDCGYALAAGVNLNLHPWKYISFSKSRMLSPSGQCRAFDKDADGYVPGDGVGVVLLQRLDDAVKQGSHIYGIIKGSAVNHGGKALSITAPAVEAQCRVIQSAYTESGFSPESVTYLEAHGTGTSLGDPIEVEALTRVFRKYSDKKCYCKIGSVKTNIGHLEAAAGIAGVIKVLLMMKYRRVPKSLNVRTLNPIIEFEKSPFIVAQESDVWNAADSELPLRAGVSSFGFGGANSHVLLESYQPEPAQSEPGEERGELFLLSANSKFSLEACKKSWKKYLDSEQCSGQLFADICATLRNRKCNLPYRFGCFPRNKEELRGYLETGEGAFPVKAGANWNLYIGELLFEGYSDLQSIVEANGTLSRNIRSVLDFARHIYSDESVDIHTMFEESKWHPASREVFSFVAHYAFCKTLIDIYSRPELIISGKTATRVALALSGILPLDDAMREIAGQMRTDSLVLYRPEIPFYDHADGNIIRPCRFDDNYFSRIGRSLYVDDTTFRYYFEYAEKLVGSQFTFQKYLDEWEEILSIKSISIKNVLSENSGSLKTALSDRERSLVVIAIASSLERLNRKWGLTSSCTQLPEGVSAIVCLLEDGLLSKEEAVGIVIDKDIDTQKILEKITANADLIAHRIAKSNRENKHPLSEISSPSDWLEKLGCTRCSYREGFRNPVFSIGKSNCDIHIDQGFEHKKLENINDRFDRFLLELWKNGAGIGWEKTNREAFFKRAALPAYVFDTKPYWPDNKNNSFEGKLHADMKSNRDKSQEKLIKVDESTYRRILRPQHDEIISETVVDKHCIIPSPLSIEMAIEACESKLKKPGFYLRNLRFPNMGVVNDLAEVFVCVDKNKNTIAIDCDGQRICVCKYQEGGLQPTRNTHSFPISLSKVGNHITGTKESIYREFASWGYAFGKKMRCIDFLAEYGDNYYFRVDSPHTDEGLATGVNPFLLDGIFQAGIYAASRKYRGILQDNKVYVSHFIESLQIPELLNENCIVLINKNQLKVGERKSIHSDIGVYSLTGTLLMEVRGISYACVNTSAIGQESIFSESDVATTNLDEELLHECEVYVGANSEKLTSLEQGMWEVEEYGAYLLLREFSKYSGIRERAGRSTRINKFQQIIGVTGKHKRLFHLLFDTLVERGHLEKDDEGYTFPFIALNDDQLDTNIDRLKEKLENLHSELKPFWVMLEHLFSQYIEILTGHKTYVDVLFPRGDASLFHNIYKENKLSDYYNGLVASLVSTIICEKIPNTSTRPVRILEIGAGTGGTSAIVLEGIKEYGRDIEYVYTDVSVQFVNYGRTKFGSDYPFVSFRKLDIEEDAFQQGFSGDLFDIVIETNAIHATSDISESLKVVKSLLRSNGVIVFNELTQRQDYWTFVGGVIDGWWLAKDTDLRIHDSPLLDIRQWQHVLKKQGFWKMYGADADRKKKYGQTVLYAFSESESVPAATAGVNLPEAAPLSNSENNRKTDNIIVAVQDGRSRILDYLVKKFSQVLHLDPAEIDPNTPFGDEYGVDSLVSADILHQLEAHFGKLSPVLLYEHTTINNLGAYLMSKYGDNIPDISGPGNSGDSRVNKDQDHDTYSGKTSAGKGQESARQAYSKDDIAIIGVSGRFPMADNIDELWENLRNGKNCIEEVPESRWDNDKLIGDSDSDVYTKWGGFIKGHDKFDPMFFSIAPRQAHLMDPQQRIFLETAWGVIEDAGYTRESIGSNVGVFVGATTNTYSWYAAEESRKGKLKYVDTDNYDIANRVSYFFDFQGPSIAIDTACSSSLTALHLATQSIKLGECEAAVVGGINLTLHPSRILQFCKKNMLLKGNRCHPFGEGNGGFIDAEGTVAVLIKPIKKAIEDQDHIYGVVKGTAINSGGRTKGYTVPNPERQADLITTALDKSGVSPESISYIEAHGTGTVIGDPIEIEGLKRAFEKYTDEKQYCSIGSIKGNIGHLIAAAGLSGLVKVLLQFKHKQIVPSLHSETLNRHIDFENSPFRVQAELSEWKTTAKGGISKLDQLPRRAAVSSFGAGGSNAHAILEEYFPENNGKILSISNGNVFVLSAKDPESLKRYAGIIRNKLESIIDSHQANLVNALYTLQTGRECMESRLAIPIDDSEDLFRKLNAYIEDEPKSTGIYLRHGVKPFKQSKQPGACNASMHDADNMGSRNEYDQAAALWVSGIDIDWSKLYDAEQRQELVRLPLPSYPFFGERYWIGLDQCLTNREQLSPYFLDKERVVSNSGGVITYSFTPENTIMLKQHIVFGQYVLPTDALLDMVCTNAVDVLGATSLRIDDLHLHSPVFGRDDGDARISQIVRNEHGRLYVTFRNTSDGSSDCGEIMSCIIQLDSTQAGKHLDISDYWSRAKPVPADARLNGCGELGEFLYNISEQRIGSGYTVARISLGDEARYLSDRFIVHPGILDSMFAAAIGFARNLCEIEESAMHIPVHIHRIQLREALVQPESWVLIKAAGIDSAMISFDVALLNGQGDVIMELTGLDLKPVSEKYINDSYRQYFGAKVNDKRKIRLKSIASNKIDKEIAVLNESYSGKSRKCVRLKALDQMPSPDDANSSIKEVLVELFSESMSLDQTRVDSKAGFTDLGMDSILGVEFIQSLNRRFKTSLNASHIYEYPTFDQLAEKIALDSGNIIDKGGVTQDAQENFDRTRKAIRQETCGIALSSLKEILCDVLTISSERVDEQKTFIEMGMDSILGVEFVQKIGRLYGTNISATAIYEYSTLDAFRHYISTLKVEQNEVEIPDHRVNAAKEKEKLMDGSIQEKVKSVLAHVLGVDRDRIDESRTFVEHGMDSIISVEFTQRLNREYGIALKGTTIYEHPYIENLSEQIDALAKTEPSYKRPTDETEQLPLTSAADLPEKVNAGTTHAECGEIAIVGMAAKFPESNNVNEFWKNIENASYSITDVPKSRWDYRDIYCEDSNDDAHIYCKTGGFIADIDKFDPLFFNISCREAEAMDPQLRQFLQIAWSAVEDAGLTNSVRGSKTGLYLGNCFSEYYELIRKNKNIDRQYAGIGNVKSTLSNRVSYFMDLHGPSLTVDTACSSSLVALDLACQALKNKTCTTAIVGGVNINLTPDKYFNFCAMSAFSKSGIINPFDASADGYVPGEGIAAIVIKPLEDAIRDSDNIHGIIKGIQVNFGGKAPGPTVPNAELETQLMRETWDKAGIDPETIGYFEAHGTGTNIGDPLEFNSITKAFSEFTKKSQFCALGTVKANIGHTEATAGLAGVIKVLLQLKNRKIPKMPNLKNINPMISLDDSPLYINRENIEWVSNNDVPRRAAVSSFGMGGTYAHLVLEEHIPEDEESGSGSTEQKLFVLSAKTDVALKRYADLYSSYIADINFPSRRNGVLVEEIKGLIGRIACLDINDLSSESDFDEMGLDAMQLNVLADEFNDRYNLRISTRDIKQDADIAGLARRLRKPRKCDTGVLGDVSANERSDRVLDGIIATLQQGREHMEFRLAIVCTDLNQLMDGLTAYLQGIGSKRIRMGRVTNTDETRHTIHSGSNLANNEKDLLRIAQQWVEGNSIDWEQLNTSCIAKVSIPTYPFAEERYWIETDRADVSAEMNTDNGLHPLLGENTSKLSSYKFSTWFSGEEYYLRDHIIRDKKILPGSAHLEMATVACALSSDEQVVEIRDIVFISPVIVENKRQVHVGLKQKDGGIEFEIWSIDRTARQVTHSQGLIITGHDAMQQVKKLDVRTLRAQFSQQISSERCYEYFSDIGVRYGSKFRVIRNIYENGLDGLAELQIDKSSYKAMDKYVLHPALLDGALQMVLWLIKCQSDQNTKAHLHVPYSISGIKLYRPLCANCYSYVRSRDSVSDLIYRFDITITDKDGHVLAEITDFAVKADTSSSAHESGGELIEILKKLHQGEVKMDDIQRQVENLI